MAMSVLQSAASMAGRISGGESTGVAMKVITGLRYSAEISRMLNGITFMFNPYWRSADYDRQTLPIAFYFVKSWQEVAQNNVSQKQMIFYNSQSSGGSLSSGMLDVVADNIVATPREYRMEVLVPNDPLAYFDQYQLDVSTITQVMTHVFSGNGGSSVAGASKYIVAGVTAIRIIFSALSADLSAAGIMSMMLSNGRTSVNKASVDALRDSRAVLKMKEFGGWTFRYASIKNVELRKSGDVDGYWEGSITVQEMPVMTLSKGASSILSKAKTVQKLLGGGRDSKALALAKSLVNGGSKLTGGN